MSTMSRRDFLRLSAMGAAVAGGALVGACQTGNGPAAGAPASSVPPIPGPGPRWPGRVVRSQHPGVWRDRRLDPEALRQMLDASVVQLTGAPDPRAAWSVLFRPGERVALKVNGTVHGQTHPGLVSAVAGRLREAGVKPEQIVIFDRTTEDLAHGGFPINPHGPGIRCRGTDDGFTAGWTVDGSPVRLSRILAECDALVNLAILKAFTIGGISFALKNHYGSFDIPWEFHGRRYIRGVTEVNNLAPIRDRTRLVVGDVLSQEFRRDSVNYTTVGGMPALLVSADPIAMDRVGLQLATEAFSPSGANIRSFQMEAEEWLSAGAALGLGEHRSEKIRLDEIRLGE